MTPRLSGLTIAALAISFGAGATLGALVVYGLVVSAQRYCATVKRQRRAARVDRLRNAGGVR